MARDKRRERILILGAAGRDFHNFNVVFREDPSYEVVGFTATQIPGIEGRKYPPELAGELYPDGLQIWSQDDLEKIIREQKVDRSIFSYSDVSHSQVMELDCRCQASGSDYGLLSPHHTFIESSKPVVGVTAVRTGAGKSQVSRYVINFLKKKGVKVVLVRHPMPYGDLKEQVVQRFEKYEDLDKHNVTIEEREEYEQHLEMGTVVYAGVDYEKILRQAEQEADVVLWDGGNNDTPFYKPDLWLTIADPHRPGHEVSYYPGDVNFRTADAIIINKANTAPPENIEEIKKNAECINPDAWLIATDSYIDVDKPEIIKGKKVLLIEDGPTLTHGGMQYGAGKFAAEKAGAAEIVDPKPYAKGTIARTLAKYKHLGKVLPAMGYSRQQIKDLEATIAAVPAEAVVIATPMDLRKVVRIDKPAAVVRYCVEDRGEKPYLSDLLEVWHQKVIKGGERPEPGHFKYLARMKSG